MTSKLESITTGIRVDIESLVEDIKQSQRDMQEIKTSMDVMNRTFEQLGTDVHNVHRELSEVKHQQASIISDVRQLHGEVREIRQEIIELQQYSRRNNLDIRNVPVSADESLPDLMQKLATCLKIELRTEDNDVVHRVPAKSKAQQNILVRFTSTTVRDKMIKNAKKKILSRENMLTRAKREEHHHHRRRLAAWSIASCCRFVTDSCRRGSTAGREAHL
ncbi:hypothetical protein HPB49_010370 [Dermacentor silvarum]|uniref:Uncharacterized protein n=1 Tax=Dermacentor silvarum TaxID=543639 RepID=A0ACB8DYZ8_DERSI|nr:hypothetical protein HPB49_010370 [Dermacentor silvarum]